jgi:hypothetical protein
VVVEELLTTRALQSGRRHRPPPQRAAASACRHRPEVGALDEVLSVALAMCAVRQGAGVAHDGLVGLGRENRARMQLLLDTARTPSPCADFGVIREFQRSPPS